jgi:ABC-type dipeptide/oligopeptide/nickel transport system permease component
MTGASRFLFARLAQTAVVALVVGGLCFALMRVLPGDAAMRIAAGRYGPDAMSAEAADRVRAELGLDSPWPAQFLAWITDLVQLDLGRSLVSGAPVIDELTIQLGYSLWLAGAAVLLSLLIGPAAGIVSGLRPGSWADRLGLAASVALRSLPPAGFGSWRDILLPALTLALGLAAVSSRVTRDAVAAVSRAPYFAFATRDFPTP